MKNRIYGYVPVEEIHLRDEYWGVAKSSVNLNFELEPENANPIWTWSSVHSAHANVTISEDGVVGCFVPGDVTITMQDEITGKTASTVVHVCRPVTAIRMEEEHYFAICRTEPYPFECVSVTAGGNYGNQLVVYASDNPEAAEITPEGILTVKAPGTAHITATAESGVQAVCLVTVAESEHLYKTLTEAVQPSCTEDGNAAYSTCDDCGSFFAQDEAEFVPVESGSWILPAMNHADKRLIPAEEADCLTNGNIEYYFCEACGNALQQTEDGLVILEKDSWIIPAAGHSAKTDAAVAETCTETGLTEGSHCEVCGTVLLEQVETPALGHTVVTDTAVAAACTKPGLTEGSHCEVCGEIFTAQVEIPALGHTVVTDAAIAATCTKPGLTEGSHCEVCGEVLTEQAEIPMLAHTAVNIGEYAAPTCVQEGKTEGKVCSVCGSVLEEQKTIPALGHTEVPDAAVPATFTQSGLTAGSHCANCNLVIKAQQPISPLGFIELNRQDVLLSVCSEFPQLNTAAVCAKILPENASDQEILWSSSDDAVITAENGVLSAHQAGSAVITAATPSGFAVTLNAEVIGGPVMKLPAGLKRIEREAFLGIPAAVVILPEGCERIAARAFADGQIRIVRIPASVETIDSTAFAGCTDLCICGKAGSAAERFAEQNGILFIAE